MAEDLLSAQEIAARKLPGLPTSKAAIHAVARRENWYFEEKTGIGGTRRLYQVPKKYLPRLAMGTMPPKSSLPVGEALAPYGDQAEDGGQLPALTRATLAGAVAGGNVADPQLLTFAIRAFEEWAAAHHLVIAPERKAAVIALLYDYLVRGAGEKEVETFLQVVA